MIPFKLNSILLETTIIKAGTRYNRNTFKKITEAFYKITNLNDLENKLNNNS